MAFGAENYSAGELGPVQTSLEGAKHVIDLGVGTKVLGAYINGLIIEATPLYDNQPPVAVAGIDRSVPDANNDGLHMVTLNGSASSDPNDSIFSYTWRLGELEIATGATPSVELPVGTHTITLEVKDEFFVTATDEVEITILASPGLAPVAFGSSDSPGLDRNNNGFGTITFDGSGSYDPDGDAIVSYTWKEGSTVLASGMTADVSLSVGSHTVTLLVVDEWNKSGSTTIEVTVNPAPGTAPIALAGADFTIEDTEDDASHAVTFDGSLSYDPDGDAIIHYAWKIDGVTVAQGVNGTAVLGIGTYTVVLHVTDEWNRTGTDVVTVHVIEPPDIAPVAIAGDDFTVVDTNDTGEETVSLDGSNSYDPRGTYGILSWVWRLDDGTLLGNGPTIDVSLPVGLNSITLTVTDDDDVVDSDTVVVNVKPAPAGDVTRIAINFGSGIVNQSGGGGYYWNGTSNTSPSFSALKDVTGATTDISLSTVNSFEFGAPDRGANREVTENGVTFPASVVQSYLASNFDQERDGYAALRLKASRQYRYKITVVSSFNYVDEPDGVSLGRFNVGGVWSGFFGKYFEGGNTLTLDASKTSANFEAGVTAGFIAMEDGSGDYEIVLQLGSASFDKTRGLFLNGIFIEATDLGSIEENNLPLAYDDSAIVEAASSVAVDVLANDTDDDPSDILSITAFTQGENGSVAKIAGQLHYTPNTGFSGSDSFAYTVSDGTDSASATVNVTVNEVALTFANWIARPEYNLASVNRGLLDNPDGDAYVNLMEYAMGTNPGIQDGNGILSASHDSSNFTYQFRISNDSPGIVYRVQWSNDLSGSWNTVEGSSIEMISAEADHSIFEATVPHGGTTQKFFRLEVEAN